MLSDGGEGFEPPFAQVFSTYHANRTNLKLSKTMPSLFPLKTFECITDAGKQLTTMPGRRTRMYRLTVLEKQQLRSSSSQSHLVIGLPQSGSD